MYILVGVAIVIVLVLSVIAVNLQLKVRAQEKERAAAEQEQKQKLNERREYARKSIKILAQAMVEEQLTLTETSMRIAAMVQIFPLTEEQLAAHRCFIELAKDTSHIPILEEWKKLPKSKKRELNGEREKHEQKYKDFIMEACQSISADEHYLMEYIQAS